MKLKNNYKIFFCCKIHFNPRNSVVAFRQKTMRLWIGKYMAWDFPLIMQLIVVVIRKYAVHCHSDPYVVTRGHAVHCHRDPYVVTREHAVHCRSDPYAWNNRQDHCIQLIILTCYEFRNDRRQMSSRNVSNSFVTLIKLKIRVWSYSVSCMRKALTLNYYIRQQ